MDKSNLLLLIRALRRKRCISQSEAAYQLGVSQPYYSRIESGVREPNLKLLLRIFEYYELKLTLKEIRPVPSTKIPLDLKVEIDKCFTLVNEIYTKQKRIKPKQK